MIFLELPDMMMENAKSIKIQFLFSNDYVARESNNSHLAVFNHILRTVLQGSNGCLTIGNQVRHTLPLAVKM